MIGIIADAALQLAFPLGLLFAARNAAGYELTRELGTSGSDPPEWTYRRIAIGGEEPYGPSDWYKGYPTCANDAQSPINLAASSRTKAKSSGFDLQIPVHECASDDLTFLANERVWKVFFDGCSETARVDFKGEQYDLVQIHIHSPSEHAIGGSLRAAEIHWVHLKEGTDDQYLVIGVLFDVSEFGTNVELQDLWDVLYMGENTPEQPFVARVYDLLPPDPTFSHYMGSFTTPPCTEGIKWIVMTEPVIIGRAQLEDYRESVASFDGSEVDEEGGTNRPLQPLNGRDVFFVKA